MFDGVCLCVCGLTAAVPLLFRAVWWTGEYLRAEDAFPFLALFNVLRFPLSVLPIAVRMASEASVSLQRMQAFLQLNEVSEEDK